MSRTCRACTQKCCTSHSNRTLSLNGLSFFKVMMGNFRSHLEIPSHCANQIQSQGCKDAILEGPSGYLWHVILCCTGASSCFRDGWENFVSDNSIEADDVLVVRHVIDTHFLVQIFGSCGYEKQSTFTIENHGSCCLKKEDLSIICNQRWCGHKEKTTNASVFLENNFVVEQKRSENIMRIKNLTLQNENSSNIKEIEDMDMGILPSKGKQVHIAEASYTEACISNDSPESLDNHVLLTPPKIDIKHAIRLPKSRCQVSGNQVGLCAEQPIVLDDEEDLSVEASSAYTRDLATVEACDHSGFEVLQEKPLGVGDYEDTEPTETNKPKLSLVMTKTAVNHPFWLRIPQAFAKRWLPRVRTDVLLLGQTGKWWVKFVGDRDSHGIGRGIGRGWKYFVIDNKLGIGDTCVFEVETGVNHIWKVHILKGLKEENPPSPPRRKKSKRR